MNTTVFTDPLGTSDYWVSRWLWQRKGRTCTMCNRTMVTGYCEDLDCTTYPAGLAVTFIARFKKALKSTHRKFKRKVDPNSHTPALLVSGGQAESKRRKH